MKSVTHEMKKSSRRSFSKSAITALAIAPFVSLSSQANDEQDLPKLRQTSPITIGGGGSVGIDFNQQWFTGKRGDAEFSHYQDTLHKLWLIDKYGALENITPGNEDCTVTVQCEKGSKVRKVTITGKPLGLAFDTVEFPKKKPDDGKKEIHHNKAYKIVRIEVVDNVTGQKTAYEPPTKGKCTIVVVNSL